MKPKILFTIILLLSGVTALQAQFFYYPFPPSKSENALNEKAQVKICYEYKLTGNKKTLSRTLEYGNGGLPTALYETGLRYNAKDMLVQEARYTKDDEKQFTYQWEYNCKGQILIVTGTSAEEQVFYECLMEYGKNNLLSKRTENIPDEETGIYVYEYRTDCRQSPMNNIKNKR